MLGFGILTSRSIAEEKSLVQLLVYEVLIDRLRTLGAADRIHHHVVLHSLQPDYVADRSLGDPEFLLRSDPAGKYYGAGPNGDANIAWVERDLLVESVANKRPQLVVAQPVDAIDVLVILFHESSGSAQAGGSGYRKNSSDAPIVRARLFFQNVRAWAGDTAAVPPDGFT